MSTPNAATMRRDAALNLAAFDDAAYARALFPKAVVCYGLGFAAALRLSAHILPVMKRLTSPQRLFLTSLCCCPSAYLHTELTVHGIRKQQNAARRKYAFSNDEVRAARERQAHLMHLEKPFLYRYRMHILGGLLASGAAYGIWHTSKFPMSAISRGMLVRMYVSGAGLIGLVLLAACLAFEDPKKKTNSSYRSESL